MAVEYVLNYNFKIQANPKTEHIWWNQKQEEVENIVVTKAELIFSFSYEILYEVWN
jgi:hypothetical protein